MTNMTAINIIPTTVLLISIINNMPTATQNKINPITRFTIYIPYTILLDYMTNAGKKSFRRIIIWKSNINYF